MPAPEAPLGLVGITPSQGTPGPPDSRRPTPQVPKVAQAAGRWCGQMSPEVPGEPTVALLDERCRESEPQRGRQARCRRGLTTESSGSLPALETPGR